jgi:hypothetical protein
MEIGEAQTAREISKRWHKGMSWFDPDQQEIRGFDNVSRDNVRHFGKIHSITADFPNRLRLCLQPTAFQVRHYWRTKISHTTRQTNCFVREEDCWRLIHQQLSLPANMETGQAIWEIDAKWEMDYGL